MQMEQDIPASVVVRVYLLGPLELWKKDPSGAWKVVPKEKWKNSKPARAVFKRLLVQPGRRLARSTVEDDIWSESEHFELVAKSVYNAISLFRGIIGKPLVTCWEAAYAIADQTLVWTDLDACTALLKEAEDRRGSIQAMPLLEHAVALLERGELLEGENGRWCYAFRQRAEDQFRHARLWLAESYEAQGKRWQAGEQYRAMIFTNPSDEDALQHWLEMLARHGKRQEALKCYQDMRVFMEEQGFPLSPEMEQKVTSLNTQSPLALTSLFPPFEGILEQGISRIFGALDMDTLRRTITQSLLGMATATVVAPYSFDLLERFSDVLSKPFHLDDTILCELENHTSSYWHHRLQATFPSHILLENACAHFSLLIQLLRGPLTASERQRLCAIGSETSQIIGMLLFDLRKYAQARHYFFTAIRAAQEAEHSLLETLAWGNLSFAWTYDDNPLEALPCIQKARMFASAHKEVPLMIQAELASREAEVFSLLGEYDACHSALTVAEQGAAQAPATTLRVGIHFDIARWAGYQGACLRRFYQQNCQESHVFLPQAEKALQTALQYIPPTHTNRRSTLELDLAEVFLAKNDLEGATQYAIQAALITKRTGSQMISQRLRLLRQNMGERHSTVAQELDHQLARLALLPEEDQEAM